MYCFQALTDDEARRNWEKYGNPDGPGAMSFGIALPSWIVEKENSVWVLGLYALVFMVAMPTAVSSHYCNYQIKWGSYSKDNSVEQQKVIKKNKSTSYYH